MIYCHNELIKEEIKMSNIISIANQKGGIGKSSTALNLGAGLARKGNKVLLLDMDPQCNLSLVFQKAFMANNRKTILEIYENPDTPFIDLIATIDKNLFAVQGDKRLLSTERGAESGDEWVLADKLDEVKEAFDFIIIDTPPLTGFLTTTALLTSNSVIIPVQADLFSFQGIKSFCDSVAKIKKRNNPDITIDGVVLTRFAQNTLSGKKLMQEYDSLASSEGTKIIGAIPENVAIRDSILHLTDVFSYDKNSSGARAYSELVDTVEQLHK